MLGIPNLAACLATMTVLQLSSLECLLMKSIWVGIKRGTLLATGLRAYAADPDLQQEWMMICLKADERDVYEFFSRAGKVPDVRLIMDCNSRRSKGVGYIEFYDAMSVSMAIAHSGQPLLGQPVMVKPSEAEKNLVESTSVVSGPGGMIGPYSGGARRLYVGNLHTNIKEDDLRQVFGAFGPVELVQLPVDETNCKGFGFVQVCLATTFNLRSLDIE
ncbi:unnamed protein product [Prunus armeniaca]|uniref:RRM domain-containing protein n=1 Tax=Prunus armeniaca TaxID=36596 RepID=A0A6J5VT39_PRUAR|nr:unnamed protein product [Prunus armeniaca]